MEALSKAVWKGYQPRLHLREAEGTKWDFVHKYDVDCDWRRGVLRLKGSEVLACRRYTVGDGLCRRLVTHRKTVVPAGTQVVVETCVRTKDAGGLPDWGLTSPTQKSIETYGVVTGSALVDPR